jgi:molecular chaperone DnaK
VGLLKISSESIKRDLPVGSDIELTLKIDESRIITVNAYVPILDEEFEIKLNPQNKTTAVPVLVQEHEYEIKRLNRLLEQAKELKDEKAVAGLEKIKASPLIQELRDAMAAAKGDPDAASKGESRLLELKLGLDEIENLMKWPALVTEARDWLDDLDKVAKGTGSSEIQGQAAQLQKEIDSIIANKEVDRLARKISNVKSLFFKALGSLPSTWVNEFNRLQKMQGQFSDSSQAQRLLEMGQNFLAQNNVDGLKNCVFGLWALLPKAVVEQAKLGFGATITR